MSAGGGWSVQAMPTPVRSLMEDFWNKRNHLTIARKVFGSMLLLLCRFLRCPGPYGSSCLIIWKNHQVTLGPPWDYFGIKTVCRIYSRIKLKAWNWNRKSFNRCVNTNNIISTCYLCCLQRVIKWSSLWSAIKSFGIQMGIGISWYLTPLLTYHCDTTCWLSSKE